MKFQAIKGVRDILPPESALWNRVEQAAREVFATYGYGEIRLPIFEPTELFRKSVGEETDIVGKEMYSESDPPILSDPKFIAGWNKVKELAVAYDPPLGTMGDESRQQILAEARKWLLAGYTSMRWSIEEALENLISLRPEATASVVRAYIEHGMHTWPSPVKLYYVGPMFRRERPQKGRYRQFYQIGAELLGPSDDPGLDAEVIEMLLAFFERIRLTGATLFINSIGDKNCRPAYVERLRGELQKVRDKLGADSQRRIETNPLRVLDSKLPEEQPIIDRLPHIADCLCEACREHYEELKRQLALRKIEYEENWRLVRGLDYYMRTTFEITAPGLGSQNAVCGGGRYDGLVELLGGPAATKGIGFAIGTDRLILSLQNEGVEVSSTPDVFMAWLDGSSYQEARSLASVLRGAGLVVEIPAKPLNPREALGLANKRNIPIAVVIGQNEVSAGVFSIRLLSEREQFKAVVANAPEIGRLLVFRALLERTLRQLAKRIPTAEAEPSFSKLLSRLEEQNMLPGTVSYNIRRAMEVFDRVAHNAAVNKDEMNTAVASALFALQGLSRSYGAQIPLPPQS